MKARHAEHPWELRICDPLAVPNACISLALIRCVRRLPGACSSRRNDEIGLALAPVFEPHREHFAAVIEEHRKAVPSSQDWTKVDLTNPALLQDVSIVEHLGEQLCRAERRYLAVFDEVEEHLAHFVDIHWHPFQQNVKMLLELVDLPEAEGRILSLAAAFCHGSISRELFTFVKTIPQLYKVLPALCGARGSSALRLFDADRPLAASGLFHVHHSDLRNADLDDRLALTVAGERLVTESYANPADMACAVLTRFASPTEDAPVPRWPHLEREHALLKAMIASTLVAGTSGINVLIHGAPGTGKTEFVRHVLAEVGAEAFAVECTDERGREADRDERLASLRLGQAFTHHAARSVLVLDEAEDIFLGDYNNPLARLLRPQSGSKAWMNTLLESNSRPVIWITNAVGHLDPAYLRRFAFCLEFPQTPYSLRRVLAEQRLGPMGCTEAAIDGIARLDNVTPALLTSAARFATMSQSSGLSPDAAVLVHVNQHLRAAGHDAPPARAEAKRRFDTRYLNIAGASNADDILKALKGGHNASVLLSGPPGTGKTQFAHEIASRLGRQLVVRTASDINSKWYGESEANVAKMFRDCDPASEVLFLDEADVLLGARSADAQRADRAVSGEFLRWLEAFQGTFVCATNHPEIYDPAMARRFMFRLQFQPLDRAQRWSLLCEWAGHDFSEGLASMTDLASKQRLDKLDHLTPGDFANVRRRANALTLPSSAWIAELEAEHAAKGGTARAIGFV